MNRKLEIEARLNQIAIDMDADGADLDALEQEARSLKAELDGLISKENRKKAIAAVISGEGTVVRSAPAATATPQEFTAASPEYRDAWLKTIAIDKRGRKMFGELTDVERRAYTFMTTTTAAVVPTDIVNRVVELVRSESPMLADATITSFTRGFGVPRHKSIDAGDAKAVAEGVANEDEQDTFDLLDLPGVEIKKHVVMSRKMEIQSLSAFADWLVKHLADRIRVGKEKHIITRLDDADAGIAAENKINGTLSDAEVRRMFSLLEASGSRVAYANSSMIWTVLAGLVDGEGKKLFIPNSMGDPIVAGRIYGAAIKEDPHIADNKLYLGVKGAILANDFDALEIIPDQEPKTLNRIWTGYSLFDAGLENPKAFVEYTHSPA